MKLKFKKLNPEAAIPSFAHAGDSGMDVSACETVVVKARSFALIKTGIAAIIPPGYEIQVRPRSGLQCKHGIVGAWGTVDEGYRGDIGVALYNHTDEDYVVSKGARIAQLVLAPVVRPEIEETDDLGEATERGSSGFGSTGVM